VIVVRVELWVGGNPNNVHTLGLAKISNDGSGTATSGNYVAELYTGGMSPRKWKLGAVKGFPRKRLLGWDLLYRALRELVGDRNRG